MDEKTIIGYHATSKENIESILENGFNLSKQTKFKKHWLGKGVYFFEDCYYAVNWNVLEINKELKKGNIVNKEDYTILKSCIVFDEDKAINLSSAEGTIIYKYMKEKIKEKYIMNNRKNDIDFLNGKSSKFWIDILEENGAFDDLDVLIAVYIEKDKQEIEFSDDFIYGYQMQVCVKNIDCIKNTEEYKNKEDIEKIYNMIYM